jgi:hypothetical protein
VRKAGISIQHGAGTVTNGGTIIGGLALGYGIDLGAGGVVTNTGSINGAEDAIRISGGRGTVITSGRLTATADDGTGMFAGGNVTSAAGAAARRLARQRGSPHFAA